ncbi:MAG TPA: preprotein translocase subunit YajC [Tepidisphaeraceae bacterium]|nr:preprotein translocase subunit YajC [Tepidisphaeraceae bacterium]
MTALIASFVFQQAGGSGMISLVMMAAIFGVFYVLLIMPQQRRQKKWQAMLGALKSGDRVTTSGGIQGTILSIRSEEGDAGVVTLRVPPDNLRIEVTRSSIVSVKTEDGSQAQ